MFIYVNKDVNNDLFCLNKHEIKTINMFVYISLSFLLLTILNLFNCVESIICYESGDRRNMTDP